MRLRSGNTRRAAILVFGVLSLAMATPRAGGPILPTAAVCVPRATVPGAAVPNAADVGSASGGWMPTHLNACALGFGLMGGGLWGMGINPLGGATAFALGLGVALLTC